MEQFVVFLVIGAIALLKWLAAKGGAGDSTKNTPSAGGTARRPQETESEEVRMRRFMEALGMPPGSAPPRTPQPQSQRPLRTRGEILEQQRVPRVRKSLTQVAPPQLPREPVVKPVPAPVRAPMLPAESEVTDFTSAKTEPVPVLDFSAPRNDVSVLLRSRAGLRDAFILREILGLPRGLQSPF